MKKEEIPEEVRKYMSKIGKKGGAKSKRRLTSEEARRMVRKRITKKNLPERLSKFILKNSEYPTTTPHPETS